MRKVIESIDNRFTYGRGDEGAWAPSVNNDQALEIAEKTAERCGYKLGKDIALGIDFASSSFWDAENNIYDYARQGIKRDTGEQIEFANRLMRTTSWRTPRIPSTKRILKAWRCLRKRTRGCLSPATTCW
jgi:enolase